MLADEPNLPLCGNGCLRRVELYAKELRPVEMLVFGCRACGDCIICTRLPHSTSYVQSLFKGVFTKDDVFDVIDRESFRIGLPRPKVATK